MTIPKATRFAFTTKTIGVTGAAATEMEVETVANFYFPTLGAGEVTRITVSSDENYLDPAANYEEMEVTAIDAGDPFLLTLVRDDAWSSTGSKQEWPAGSYVMAGITAGGMEEIRAFINGINGHLVREVT
jgi:hypothetical protein